MYSCLAFGAFGAGIGGSTLTMMFHEGQMSDLTAASLLLFGLVLGIYFLIKEAKQAIDTKEV